MLRPSDIPNLISLLRILLSVPVVWALLEQRFGIALVLFLVAGISDGLDGYLAKRFDWQSRLGGLLDPLADKALLISSVLCLGGLDLLPTWLVALVILRDVVIVTGALIYNFGIEELEADPSLISKLNTVLQILLVLLVVWNAGLGGVPASLLDGMVWAVAGTTLASGIGYVFDWGRRAKRHGRSD